MDSSQGVDTIERLLIKHPVIVLAGIICPPLYLFVDDSHYDNLSALSSVFYLFLDPLFMYAPLVNEDLKCITLDNNLKIVALIFRSLGDLRYLVPLYFLKKNGWTCLGQTPNRTKSLLKSMLRLANDIFSVLPIPHVATLMFLPNMRGFYDLQNMKTLKYFMICQYVSRAYPVYTILKNINERNILEKNGPRYLKLVSIVVNIYGYIIASHVFGALWYLCSIEREIQCWGLACRAEHGCEFSTSCVQDMTRNITLIDNLCPIDSPDKQVFNFGVFLDVLQSGMTRSTSFSQKWLKCFSWGLRNLSSFGSNLNDTSMLIEENIFVAAIAMNGLMLFVYLMGHIQTFMQKYINRTEKGMTVERKMESILSTYDLSDDELEKIKRAVKEKLEEDENYIVENMSSIILLEKVKSIAVKIKRALFLDKLKKVEELKNMDHLVCEKICEHLKPMIYGESSYIIREGEPLDMMFFITEGTALIFVTNNSRSCDSLGVIQHEEEKSGLNGEELLTWAKGHSAHLSNLPFSTVTIKSHNKVEVFAIKAIDLQRVVSQCGYS